MGPISCLALIALVAVRSGNAVGNCKGQCIPGKTQQGKFSVAVGNLLANLGDLDVFYFANDMELGRYYIKGLDFDSKGDQSSVEALLLYTENPPVRYIIINGTICVKTEPSSVFAPCIPDDASYAGTIRLGNAANHIQAGVYLSNKRWIDKPSDKEDKAFQIVMEDDCTPVVFGFEGIDGAGDDVALGFVIGDSEPTVDDPSVFKIPDICK